VPSVAPAARQKLERPPADRPLGVLIRDRRKALGFTQQQLAKILRVNHAQVSRWEAGLRPTPFQIVQLATVLHLSLSLSSECAQTGEPIMQEVSA